MVRTSIIVSKKIHDKKALLIRLFHGKFQWNILETICSLHLRISTAILGTKQDKKLHGVKTRYVNKHIVSAVQCYEHKICAAGT